MYLPWLHSGVMRSREKCTTPKPVGHSLWCNARAQKGRRSHSPQHQQKAACEPHGVDSAPQQKRLNQLQTKINQTHNFVFDSGEGIERANEMLDTMFKKR